MTRSFTNLHTRAGLLRLLALVLLILSQSIAPCLRTGGALATAPESPPSPANNLLAYKDEGGEIAPILTPADWELRREEIQRNMQKVMGALPGSEKRVPLRMEVLEEVDCGTYVRQKIVYRSEPKSYVPAYLLVPKQSSEQPKVFPAVLCLHPTDNTAGNRVVVGLGGRANRNYAQELAELGFVTLAPAYPLLADYQPNLQALRYESGTMKAIWDNIRALDLLDSLDYVSKEGYGVIGHSLGGHNGIFTAVFDPRLRVIVSSCGFDSFKDYKGGDISGWTSQRYMPKLLEYPLNQIPFDFHELIASLAPRVCFISAPFYDDNFQWRSVYKIEAAAARIYQLYDARENLQVAHPSCGHDFPQEMREKAYALFKQHLTPRR